MTVLPILVTGHFGGEAYHLAWIEAAFGAGLFVGGFFLGVWGGFRRKALMMPIGLVSMGIGSLLIGLSPSSAFWLAWVGMLFFGIMNSLLNGSIMTLMQTVVVLDMQGRVFTVMMSSVQAAVPLGLLIAEPIVDTMGVSIWFVIAGSLMFGLGLLISLVRPIMKLDEFRSSEEVVETTATEFVANGI